MDVLSASPESIARRQRAALEDAERLFIKSRLTGDFPAAPLSRKERDAASPSTLAPVTSPRLKMVPTPVTVTDELLAPDGNFYPPHSKLRPAVSFKKGVVYLEGPKARIYELEKINRSTRVTGLPSNLLIWRIPFDWQVVDYWTQQLRENGLLLFHSGDARGGFGNIYLTERGWFLVKWTLR